MNRPSRETCLRTFLLGAFVAVLTHATASANEYSCRVPRALLCEGCADQIAIALQTDGRCRISFTPPAAEASVAVKPPSDSVELKVEATPVVVTRFVPRRVPTAWRPHTVAYVKPASSAHCFVFNAQQYCE